MTKHHCNKCNKELVVSETEYLNNNYEFTMRCNKNLFQFEYGITHIADIELCRECFKEFSKKIEPVLKEYLYENLLFFNGE